MRCLVIHPEGDRSSLQVLRLTAAARDSMSKFVMATRHVFDDDKDAEEYARDLAGQNRARYLGIEGEAGAIRA